MQQRTGSSAAVMRRWLTDAADVLDRHQDELNSLNIFPVADADTGTNLAVTVRAGAQAADMVNTTLVGELFEICGRHCLEEAKGNSGTLFAVILAGCAEPLRDQTRMTAFGFARALEYARTRVLGALHDPVEGTILSFVNDISRAAGQWTDPDDSNKNLCLMLTHLVDVGHKSVGRTSTQLEVLRDSGRVDAGALGMLIIFDVLAHTVRGETYPGAEARRYAAWLEAEREEHLPVTRGAGSSGTGPAVGEDGVELMCAIELEALAAAQLRHELSQVGDSVIMTAVSQEPNDKIRWRVHVHVPDASTAMSVLSHFGKPLDITTESLSAEDT